MENIQHRNRTGPVKIVTPRTGYPGLKSIKMETGITHRSIFRQMEHMNPGNFSNIISGARREPIGFTNALIQALKNLGIDTTEKELKQNEKA